MAMGRRRGRDRPPRFQFSRCLVLRHRPPPLYNAAVPSVDISVLNSPYRITIEPGLLSRAGEIGLPVTGHDDDAGALAGRREELADENVARQVREQGGHYLLPVKVNQPHLQRACERVLSEAVERDFAGPRYDQGGGRRRDTAARRSGT